MALKELREQNSRLKRLLAEAEPRDQTTKYYGLDPGDFPEPSDDRRVLVLLSTP